MAGCLGCENDVREKTQDVGGLSLDICNMRRESGRFYVSISDARQVGGGRGQADRPRGTQAKVVR